MMSRQFRGDVWSVLSVASECNQPPYQSGGRAMKNAA
jgi:hypothetical protein